MVIAESTVHNRRTIIMLDVINAIPALRPTESHFAHKAIQELKLVDSQFKILPGPRFDGFIEEKNCRDGGRGKTFDLEIIEMGTKFVVEGSDTSLFGECNCLSASKLFHFQSEDVSKTASRDYIPVFRIPVFRTAGDTPFEIDVIGKGFETERCSPSVPPIHFAHKSW